MIAKHDILWEGSRYWVGRLAIGKRDRRIVTQVYKIGSVASESIETYAGGKDGESIAVARAKYLEQRDERKYEAEKDSFRLERPEMFAYRILAYLSRFGGSGCWPVELVGLAREVKR